MHDLTARAAREIRYLRCGYTNVFNPWLRPGGGGVLPYIGYTGMCRWRGYSFIWSGKGFGFQAIWSGKGYGFQAIWSGIGSSNHRKLF